MSETMLANPRAVVGGNNPPPPSPLEAATKEIEDLYGEALLWMDGGAVESQDLADGVSNLLNMIRAAEKRADEARKIDKAPHLNAAKAVDDAYKPIITKAQLAATTCRNALTPWLAKVEAEKRAVEDKARADAEAKAQAARAAMQATDGTHLDERAKAEALADEAKRAARAATRAGNDKAKAGSVGRTVSLRTSYRAEVTDMKEFARHVWQRHHDELAAFLTELAQRQVTRGQRELPGVTVHTEHKAV